VSKPIHAVFARDRLEFLDWGSETFHSSIVRKNTVQGVIETDTGVYRYIRNFMDARGYDFAGITLLPGFRRSRENWEDVHTVAAYHLRHR
jgi:hypothetical protein